MVIPDSSPGNTCALERIAKERGNKWLRIEVLARNGGARRLYERSGFLEHLVMLEKEVV
jgi:ribosomal protein S18 acetylase RimI-like enzyme